MKNIFKFTSFASLLIILVIFCKEEDTVTLNESRYILAENGLFLRDYPSIESEVITKIPFNEEVLVTKKLNSDNIDGINDFWFETNYKSFKGYIFGGYTSLYSLDLHTDIKVDSIGTIGPKKEEYLGERLHFPEKTKINVYDRDNKKVGFIEKGESYIVLLKSEDITNSIVKSTMIGYDGIGIEIFELNKGKGKIFIEEKNLYFWIDIKDFESYDLVYYSWIDFFYKFDKSLFPTDTLYLKERPDSDSKTLLKINDLRYNLSLTGKNKGRWSEVKIQKFFDQNGIFGDFPKPINEYKGWIEILDKKENPKVWFHAKGC